ncbi:LysR family transcriptional regulator [Variovorax ginsengisoli]|uniref:LysR family transcriptional regulator n=1 Tax=Variovorax ginsengisoli TaxID=363844 RepID=A0ABT8SGC1_9BURK|nr:LysR family transcriptional regulator [Variovorax ginsengisoli]MDN8618238.1 LysR family transcriptional regulator [Variovorax ginsengisoli]MDO1537408.1 LysR family transcriptional regulator [Variovorax ginsengisoli]
MTFDLQHLIAFNAIVSSGSLGRAAAALNVTQPALSRTIRRLEEQAGAPLFERHSKGMELTEVGRALQPHAVLLQRESEHANEDIKAMLGLAKGTIRVGAVGSIACLVLPLAIGATCEKWPNLQVQIIEGVWDRLANALVSHEIDLALGVDIEDTDEIVAVKDCRWEDTSYVVAGRRHPLRKEPKLKLSDTLSERWAILPKGTGPFEHMKKVFSRQNLALPNVVVETRSVTALKSLIGRSGFLGWMPEPMYDAERKAGLIDALDIPGASDRRTLTAFRRRAGMLPGPAVKLLEALRSMTAK